MAGPQYGMRMNDFHASLDAALARPHALADDGGCTCGWTPGGNHSAATSAALLEAHVRLSNREPL